MPGRTNQCAACGSRDVQFGFDEITCLECGRLTNVKTGVLVPLEEQYAPCNK